MDYGISTINYEEPAIGEVKTKQLKNSRNNITIGIR